MFISFWGSVLQPLLQLVFVELKSKVLFWSYDIVVLCYSTYVKCYSSVLLFVSFLVILRQS